MTTEQNTDAPDQTQAGFDVLITGFGPVGMLAANLLGMYGLKVAVFERNEQPYNIPRAIHIDDEVMRIFQCVGLHTQLLRVCKSVPGMQLINRKGKVLLETSKAATAGFAASYLFYQPDMEQILMEGTKRFANVEVFWGTEVNTVRSDKTKVEVLVNRQGKTIAYKGKYALACDGANSSIRELLQLKLKDLKFSRLNLKVDVRIASPEAELPRWIQKTCEPKQQSYVFLNSFGNHYRWEFALPRGKKYQAKNWEDPATIHKLLALVTNPEKAELLHVAEYRFATKIARQWHQGNTYLAGDAAHQMPPYVGQGMCAGFRDVFNLCWKLKLVMEGNAPTNILTSYASERVPHVRFIMRVTCWVGRLFITRGWSRVVKTLAWVLPAQWRKIKVPPQKLSGAKFGKNRRLRGHLMPQMKISNSGKSQLLDDYLGKGFSIISYGKSVIQHMSPQDFYSLKKIATCFCILNPQKGEQNEHSIVIQDQNEVYRTWFRKHKTDFVVIRPDRYIYDAAKISRLPDVIGQLKNDFLQTAD